jgi:dipeptidyl aminopeptidase/acylaminoacyl peptidase
VHWKILFRALSFLFLAGCAAGPGVSLTELDSLPPGNTARFFFPSAGGQAEGFLIRPRGEGPFPLVVLLHGHSWFGVGAKRVLPAADIFADEICYASLAVSLPGYGATDVDAGPLDKATRQVVLDALATARQLPWIDPKKIYVYGFSRGAVVAAALVNQMEGLRGALLYSGAYDLPRLYQDTRSYWLRKLLNPNGEADPQLYNLLPETVNWRIPTLILHGEQDTLIPVSQATLLGDQLKRFGKPYRLVLFPNYGHRLPLQEIKHQALAFLKDNGGSACKVNDR